MRALLVTLLLTPLLFAPSAAAQDEVLLELEMVDSRDGPHFRDPATGERNPLLIVPPGATARIHVTNVGTQPHSLFVGAPISQGTDCCQQPGQEADLVFTAPAQDAVVRYFCSIHGNNGMAGELRIAHGVPRVRIVSPQDGSSVPRNVDLRVEVEDFTLVEPGGGNESDRGYLRYTLDNAPLGEAAATTRENVRLSDLEPGYHLVRVELRKGNGDPLSPPAFAEATLYVAPDAPLEATPTPPTRGEESEPDGPAPTPGPGVALVVGAVGAALLLRRR